MVPPVPRYRRHPFCPVQIRCFHSSAYILTVCPQYRLHYSLYACNPRLPYSHSPARHRRYSRQCLRYRCVPECFSPHCLCHPPFRFYNYQLTLPRQYQYRIYPFSFPRTLYLLRHCLQSLKSVPHFHPQYRP